MLRQLECIVSGRVQNVFYRAFVRRKAHKQYIVGTVQNMPDGTVHIVAQGDESDLKMFLEAVKIGSIFSHVETVEEKWSNALQAFSDFKII